MRHNNRKPTAVDAHIGRIIRYLRKSHNMTQAALSEELGLNHQLVQNYEAGATRIPAARLYQLSQVFAVPFDVFFDGLSDTAEGDGVLSPEQRLMNTPRGARLARAFSAINDAEIERSLVRLVEAIAEPRSN